MSTLSELNSHEIEVLEMLSGQRKPEWGAWVGACLEFLSGHGLCTGGPNYQITDEGKRTLAESQRKGPDDERAGLFSV
jgi:hypothetical protein